MSFLTIKSSATGILRKFLIPPYSRPLADSASFDEKTYEQLADRTLDAINEKLERFLDEIDDRNCDITLNNGVLTLSLGDKGQYVINRQTPNRQLWLSSPISGPKRYDYVDGRWIYRHDGQTIQELLKIELDQLFDQKIDLSSSS